MLFGLFISKKGEMCKMKRTVIFILSACMLLICGISAFVNDFAEALSKNETSSKAKVKL